MAGQEDLQDGSIVAALKLWRASGISVLRQRERFDSSASCLLRSRPLQRRPWCVIVMFDTDAPRHVFLDDLLSRSVSTRPSRARTTSRARSTCTIHRLDLRGRPSSRLYGQFRCCPTQRFSVDHSIAVPSASDAMPRSGDSGVHQRTRTAAAVSAALSRPRPDRWPRDRVVAVGIANCGHGQRQFLARSRRPTYGAWPLRRSPIRTGSHA